MRQLLRSWLWLAARARSSSRARAAPRRCARRDWARGSGSRPASWRISPESARPSACPSVGCSISANIFTAFRCGSSNRSSIRFTACAGISAARNAAIHSAVVFCGRCSFRIMAHILGMLGTRLLRLETRIGIEQIGLADHRRECAPVLVGVDHQREMAVLGRIRSAHARQQPLVAHVTERRHEGAAAHVIGEHELRHRLQHRHFDLLAFAGHRAMMQRR